MDTTFSTEERDALLAENKRLKIDLAKATREMRLNANLMEDIRRTVNAKEAMRKALTLENAKQRAYTRMLLEKCPSIILLLDEQGKIVLCTDNFIVLSGRPNHSYVLDHPYEEIFEEILAPSHFLIFKNAFDSVYTTFETITVSAAVDFGKFNVSRHYSMEFMAVGDDNGKDSGPVSGVLAMFTDLTDFMHQKERAEAANIAKSDFLASMSHEIRTPMNAISGLAEMLGRSELDATQQKWLQNIKTSANSLLVIINDILDFSKIEAGKLELVKTSFSFRSLLSNVEAMFRVLFGNKGLELVFDTAEDVPRNIYEDENRLRQIITNILSNALKYTQQGRVDVKAYLGGAGMLTIEIKDTGIGIRAEDLDKLFKPFEQLDRKKNRNVVGTGLGLAITKQLCNLMNGDLAIKSVYGEGSTLFVSIPFIEGTAEAESESAAELGEFSAESAKILVVDDIEINLEVARAMMGVFNISPTLADSGYKAVQLALQNEYDMIFMDHMMPEMDGIEATVLLRGTTEHNSRVPIIALTANAVNGAEEMFLEHGFSGFLAKPIDISALNACFRKWLREEQIEPSGK